MKAILKSAVIVAALFTCVPGASATTLDFSFTGNNSLAGSFTSSGTGNFSFNPTSGPVSLADLTAFSFAWTTDDGVGDTAHFSIGLGDLTSFSLSSGTSLSATIMFQSGFVNNNPEAFFLPEDFGLT